MSFARLLPDGRRLHLQHGPINLVLEASAASPSPLAGEGGLRVSEGRMRGGAPDPSSVTASRRHLLLQGEKERASTHPSVTLAYQAATQRFATILDELCEELPALRSQTRAGRLRGAVAREMEAVTLPYSDGFVTPMAAVAGAVADAVLAAMTKAADLARASVNNGGDIALHLAAGESLRIGLVDRPDRPSLFGTTTIRAEDGIGGIATSGWRGRSFSLGIADAVTILARTAAEADAAATIVSNAVDLPGHPAISRRPACDIQHDSDLGPRLVTRDVGKLTAGEMAAALAAGRTKAGDLVARGLIRAAALHLQGATVTTGPICRDSPHAEVPATGRPRSTHNRSASFEARPPASPTGEHLRMRLRAAFQL